MMFTKCTGNILCSDIVYYIKLSIIKTLYNQNHLVFSKKKKPYNQTNKIEKVVFYSIKCIGNCFNTNITRNVPLSTQNICAHNLFSSLANTKLWIKTIKYQKNKIKIIISITVSVLVHLYTWQYEQNILKYYVWSTIKIYQDTLFI